MTCLVMCGNGHAPEYKTTYDGIEQKCVEGAERYVLRGGALNSSA